MDGIVATAILAALGALTGLAYSQPRQFRRIGSMLAAIGTVAGAFSAGWVLGLHSAIEAIEPTIANPAGITTALRKIMPELWMAWAFAGVMLYNVFLLLLPYILGKRDDQIGD